MSTETLILLIGAIANLLTILGGGSIFYVSITKKLKEAEVKDKNVDIELKQADAWKELYDKSQERCDRKSETIRGLYAQLNEKDHTINQKEAEILRLQYEKEACNKEHEFKEKQLEWDKCIVNGCMKRQPKREHDQMPGSITAPTTQKQ